MSNCQGSCLMYRLMEQAGAAIVSCQSNSSRGWSNTSSLRGWLQADTLLSLLFKCFSVKSHLQATRGIANILTFKSNALLGHSTGWLYCNSNILSLLGRAARCHSVQMDESVPLSLFKQETVKALKSHLATFPWYTTRHICTSLFPFKFPPKFCVSWWLKNVRTEAHAGMYSQLEKNKTCKVEDVKVSSSRHIISILQYSYRLLLLMHMSGMTAGPPSGYLSLRQSHIFFPLLQCSWNACKNFMMPKW